MEPVIFIVGLIAGGVMGYALGRDHEQRIGWRRRAQERREQELNTLADRVRALETKR